MAVRDRQYRLISADGHVNEPGDLWTSRVPAKYRDSVPRIESFDQGDAWVIEGFAEPRPFGLTACAGLPPEEVHEWMRFEDIRPGSWDPKSRVAEQDADGVDAEVLFPSGFPNALVGGTRDPEMHLAMVRAYNDWLSEFCSYAPDRLGGAALLPHRGIEQAVNELERVAQMPGFVTWLIRAYPHGDTTLEPEDDALWAAVQATGKPLCMHIGLSDTMPPSVAPRKLPSTGHFADAPKRMIEFIFSGVLDRFPDIKIFLAEVDCGWLPYFADLADDNYLRNSRASLKDVQLSRMPSEYMHDYFPAAFVTDPYAIENRHRVGVDRMLWSNDYPHITSDWPYSWKTINATFSNVAPDERQAILAGNAQRLFRFGH